MNLDYAKNSIEEVPFGQYLEQFQALDPKAAADRTGGTGRGRQAGRGFPAKSVFRR